MRRRSRAPARAGPVDGRDSASTHFDGQVLRIRGLSRTPPRDVVLPHVAHGARSPPRQTRFPSSTYFPLADRNGLPNRVSPISKTCSCAPACCRNAGPVVVRGPVLAEPSGPAAGVRFAETSRRIGTRRPGSVPATPGPAVCRGIQFCCRAKRRSRPHLRRLQQTREVMFYAQ